MDWSGIREGHHDALVREDFSAKSESGVEKLRKQGYEPDAMREQWRKEDEADAMRKQSSGDGVSYGYLTIPLWPESWPAWLTIEERVHVLCLQWLFRHTAVV